MRLGNDIVDLQAARGEHPRFAARILAPQEAQNFAARGSPPALLWSYWAAKEAAYKAYSQLKPTSFSPSLWLVSEEFDTVSFDGEILSLRLKQAEDLIIATVTDQPWEHIYQAEAVFFTEPTPGDQKAEARRLLLGMAASYLGVTGDRLQLQKTQGIPELMLDGQRLSVSLSHHGRFVAAALHIPPDLLAHPSGLDTISND